jgi:hypothetical protein
MHYVGEAEGLDGLAIMRTALHFQKSLALQVIDEGRDDSGNRTQEDISVALEALGRAGEAALTMAAMRDRLITLLGPERELMSENAQWQEIISRCVASSTVSDASPMGLMGLIELDAINAFTNETMAGFFSSEVLERNELMRKNRAFYVSEVTRQFGAVLAALSVSRECAQFMPIAWIMSSPYVWPQIEEIMGATTSGALESDITNRDRLKSALDDIMSTPIGPMTAQVLNRLRPSAVSTMYGNRMCYYRHPELIPVGIADEPERNPYVSFSWDPRTLLNSYGDEIVALAERVRDYRVALETGYKQLGYGNSAGLGAWPNLWESLPVIWSRTGWSQAFPTFLDAAFAPRMIAAEDMVQTTQRFDRTWRENGLEIEKMYDEAIALNGPMPGFVLPIVLQEPISAFPHKWEPAAYRPYLDWTGEQDETFVRMPCTVSAFATMHALTVDQVRQMIFENPGEWSDFFTIDENDNEIVPVAREIFRTWETSNPELRQIDIPYVGPKEIAIRIDRTSWIYVTFRARYEVDRQSEVLGFQTKGMLNAGITFKEESV